VQVEQSFASVQQGLRRFVEDRTRMAKELEALKAAAAPTLIPLASGPPMRTTTNTGLLTTTKRALQLKQETGNSLSAAASKIFPQIQIQPQLTHPQQQRQYVAPVKTMGGGVSLLGTVNSIISANQIHTSATELQRRPLLSVDGQQFSRFTQQPFQKTINTAENRQICDRSSSPVATQVSKPIDTTETPSSATTSANVNEFLQTLRTVLSKPDYKQFQLLLKSFKKKEIKMDRLTEEIIRLFSACNRLDLCQGLLPFLPAKHHESFADRVKRESSNAANAIESADAIMCNIDEKTVDEASDSCTKQQQQQSKSHCPMCKRKPIKPFQSRCKHVGCYDCWVIWLEASKACPICEKPTRLRQLSK
jgi:hypothetical protein